jgi:hypothetical protein
MIDTEQPLPVRASQNERCCRVILVVVVAAEVACDNTTIQKASHHHSRPVPDGCHYFGQKRDWISHLFTFSNDKNGDEG